MDFEKAVKSIVAGSVLLSFFGTWLAMEWTNKQPDSVILLGAFAIVLGAGYYLWDDAMAEGVETAEDLQGGISGGDEEESEDE